MKEHSSNEDLLNKTTNLLIKIDSSGRILYANRPACIAWHLENYIGTQLITYLDVLSVGVFDHALHRVLTDCQSYSFILTDHNRIYKTILFPLHAGCLSLCLEDITLLHQLDTKLQKTRQRLSFAEKVTNLGYWELELSTKKLYWSAEMYRIFGEKEPIISPMRNLFKERMYPEDIPFYKTKLRELLKTEKTVEGTLRIYNSQHKLLYCTFKAGIIYENHKKLIAGTFQDITNHVEIQQELQKAKKRAEELSDAKSYFLAQASHDLRQPMQALRLFISSLKDEQLTIMQKMLVNKIEDSAINLHTLLDNLLDISKIEAGGVKYQPQFFDVGELIIRLAKEYEELALKQHISFKYIPAHKKIHSDPILLERLLRNLLNNAFKYTRNKVLLGVKNSQESIMVKIIDNGCGISLKEQEKIFEDFYQSPQQPVCRIQGVGLGLGIVKRIAKLLKTKIHIFSQTGKGSCFYFSLHK